MERFRRRRLLSQHGAILADLDRIVARFADVGEAPCAEAWQDMPEAFDVFMHRLRAHDCAEHAVVQQGSNEDLSLDD